MLRQVLENLLVNAIKFSPQGSRILFNLEISAQELDFTIQDEGCGIPADELERVTLPFFRASNVTAYPGHRVGVGDCQPVRAPNGGTTWRWKAG